MWRAVASLLTQIQPNFGEICHRKSPSIASWVPKPSTSATRGEMQGGWSDMGQPQEGPLVPQELPEASKMSKGKGKGKMGKGKGKATKPKGPPPPVSASFFSSEVRRLVLRAFTEEPEEDALTVPQSLYNAAMKSIPYIYQPPRSSFDVMPILPVSSLFSDDDLDEHQLQRSKRKDPRQTIVSVPSIRLMPGLAHPLTFNEEQMLRLFVTDPRSMAYNLSNTQRSRVPLTVEQERVLAMSCLSCFIPRRQRQRGLHRVVLESEGSNFGLVVGGHQAVQGLILVDVKSCHPVAQWNRAQPQRQIRPGQAILEVNGTTETMAMLQEFKDASRVEVLIAQQLTPEQQMIFETSTQKHRRALFAKGILRSVAAAAAVAVAGEESEEVCSICHEAMELKDCFDEGRLAQTACGHRFHRKCVEEWCEAAHRIILERHEVLRSAFSLEDPTNPTRKVMRHHLGGFYALAIADEGHAQAIAGMDYATPHRPWLQEETAQEGADETLYSLGVASLRGSAKTFKFGELRAQRKAVHLPFREPFTSLPLLGESNMLLEPLSEYLGEDFVLESALVITVDQETEAQNAHTDTDASRNIGSGQGPGVVRRWRCQGETPSAARKRLAAGRRVERRELLLRLEKAEEFRKARAQNPQIINNYSTPKCTPKPAPSCSTEQEALRLRVLRAPHVDDLPQEPPPKLLVGAPLKLGDVILYDAGLGN
eukprot:s535_g6.t2